ncbi:MAG: DUF2185 domain-containing protein [Comamonas sp.]|jgi:hypothetical protein|uniref:DUF2185 domain-containing protein n=1 Tax=Comamonas sp. TaxID=34028 RepID=UPI0028326D78|nr:DUF2185 domain-containing protein [Comamonas sp.]MDR0212963.1 DUF2185 domain-containing protein [Comamonas sp.]
MSKNFALSAQDIRPLAEGHGGCIATDMITVHAKAVGYMVRETPVQAEDSGWCFMAGDETQEYMDDASHHGIYDVNTIANYCPDIIALLDTAAPCAFERNASGQLVPAPYQPPPD